MWKGVVVAYIVVALCYFPVALIGYWMFGNSVDDNILVTLEKPTWIIATANMFVVVHVIGSYQVNGSFIFLLVQSEPEVNSTAFCQIYAMPVFDMMETVLVKKMHFKPSWILRFVVRNFYVGKN